MVIALVELQRSVHDSMYTVTVQYSTANLSPTSLPSLALVDDDHHLQESRSHNITVNDGRGVSII
jgi:hypothetical protein